MLDYLRKNLPPPVTRMLKDIIRAISATSLYSWIKEANRVARRKRFAMGYYSDTLDRISKWAPKNTENDNFYYDLSDLNKLHLAHQIAALTGAPPQKLRSLFQELLDDTALRSHLENGVKSLTNFRDIEIAYGRRLGWYALARLLRPRTIVETGVHQGVGSCVLCAALIRNAAEGYEGRYFGTDINPNAGILFVAPYTSVGEILYGDSIQSLIAFERPIDLFINDSDHSAEYEYREYLTIQDKLSKNGAILGDNSHASASLPRFCAETRRPFIFFREQPKDHWYPGAGIGISIPHACRAATD